MHVGATLFRRSSSKWLLMSTNSSCCEGNIRADCPPICLHTCFGIATNYLFTGGKCTGIRSYGSIATEVHSSNKETSNLSARTSESRPQRDSWPEGIRLHTKEHEAGILGSLLSFLLFVSS